MKSCSLLLRVLPVGVLFAVIIILSARPAASVAGSPSLNVLNLLLPPRINKAIGYRLQGSNGCFTWRWDPDILSVESVYNETKGCSTSACLFSIAPYGGRKVTAVYAKDKISGHLIRCEVFIDKISRIKIFHHSVKLNLDGLAILQIQAFDNEDNVFSSLAGLNFTWQKTVIGSEQPLVSVPLINVPLSDCEGFCGRIEETGGGSDTYVVRGIGIGSETITVHLAEPKLEHLSDTIVLTVVEAMDLDPPYPIYVIIGTRLRYTLKVLRQNTHKVVNLPSPIHRWFVLNTTVASIDPTRGIVDAQMMGTTRIGVEDLRVFGHNQTSSMHVVMPSELHFYLSTFPGHGGVHQKKELVSSKTPWYFVVGRQYVVHLRAFSWESGERPLYLTESNHLELKFDDSPHWNAFPIRGEVAVAHGWHNCSRLHAISQGPGKLSASLRYYSGKEYKADKKLSGVPGMVLSVVQEVMVCGAVKIEFTQRDKASKSLQLPWLPGIHQEIELVAKEGCGETTKDYQWHSSDNDVAYVNAMGVVQARKAGRAVIKVVAIADSLNYDEVVIEVSVPSSMAMLGYLPVEAPIGSYLAAAVTLRSTSGDIYSRCDAFNKFVTWQLFGTVQTFDILDQTSQDSFLQAIDGINETELPNKQAFDSPLCAWTLLHASQAGKATLQASFVGIKKELLDTPDALASLRASWTVAAYASLIVQQAGDGNAFGGYKLDVETLDHALVDVKDAARLSLNDLLLVPGSGMTILLHGGPERWRQGVEYYESYNAVASDGKDPAKGSITITKMGGGGGRMYWVFCHSVGNFTLTFKRGNLIGDDHPLPAFAEVVLPLECNIPSSITLIVDEPANTLAVIRSTSQADRGGGCIRVTPVTVKNGRTIRVAAVGMHQSGRPFTNSSSLFLDWALNDCEELAFFVSAKNAGKMTDASSWEKFLALRNETGQCTLQATVQDSDHHVCDDAVRLQLVSALHIEPDIVVLFFHPNAKASLSIFGGTCNVEAVVNDSTVAVVVQQPSITHYMHLAVGARGLGIGTVTIRDLGLASPTAATALVRVADMDWIRILLPEETSMLLASVKDIELLAGTHDGHIFDSSQIEFMNVHVHIEDEILELVDVNGTRKPSGSKVMGSRFFVRGANIGLTSTLHVSARQGSGREILSQFAKVEVYAPLVIHPPRLFLSPGATYTLTVKGGPQGGLIPEYSSMDVSIASVESASGKLFAGSLGNTSIRARVNDAAGESVCEAYGEVIVGIPSSMSLNFANAHLGIGREMSVFPKAAEGDLFSFYELCRNYKWTIGDGQVLGFRNIGAAYVRMRERSNLEEKGQLVRDYADLGDAGFTIRVIGRSAGKTTIGTSFSCDFSTAGKTFQSVSYKASDTIWIVPDLPLALGMPQPWLLPPFYTTSDVLLEWTEPSFLRDLRSHKGHVIYSMLKTNATEGKNISITGGRIKTLERNTIDCIEAKDYTTGRFEIAACVRVAEISRLAVEIEDFPFHIVDLSAGADQDLNITYCDNLGNPFFEAHGAVPLFVDTNHPGIVSTKITDIDNMGSLTNDRLYVQASQDGQALVRLMFQRNMQSTEFIMIRVGAYIRPKNPILHIGGRLKFSISGNGLHGSEKGHWSSANEGVVIIDSPSGEAQGVGEGTTQVSFRSSRVRTHTTVTVVRVASVMVSPPSDSLTNVAIPEKGYNFSVKFSDYRGHSFRAFGEDMGISYDCFVDPPYIGDCKPWKDSVTGAFYCSFIPYSPEHLARTLPGLKGRIQNFKVGDQNGVLQISIIAALGGSKEVSGSADVLFMGGFSVPDMRETHCCSTIVLFMGGFSVPDMREFHLTPTTNRSRIMIVGSAGGVKLYWQAKDSMSVTRISYNDLGIGAQAEYEVRVLKQESFNDKLEIILPTTGQRMDIDVRYEPGKLIGTNFSLELTSIIVVISLISLVLTIIIYLRLLDQPEPSRQFGTEQAPELSNMERTPVRSQMMTSSLQTPASSQSYPRTPAQPYTEYIRRTMDDTPLFRKDGRKRFDPSYTY